MNSNAKGDLDLQHQWSPDVRAKANKTMGAKEFGLSSRLSRKSFHSVESASEKAAFAHCGHEDWTQEKVLQKTLSGRFSTAKRFNYRRDDRINAERSQGPTTGHQVSSFQLPEIYKHKVPETKSRVFAKTHRELSQLVQQRKRERSGSSSSSRPGEKALRPANQT